MTPDDSVHPPTGLKLTISDVTAAKKSLAVEVSAAEVSSEYERACRKYSRSLKVPGFRQGKVPLEIVRQRFGREIQQETVEHVIEHALAQAVKEASLRPLRAPVLRDYSYAQGGPLSFVAELEVTPRVTLKGHRDIRVRIAEPAVTDQMVSEAFDVIRERAARFDPVEGRGVHQGDYVLMDIKGRIDGAGGREFSQADVMIEIGSGGPHPELTDALRDAMPGETREFEISYQNDHPNADFAGHKIAYRVAVREIKQKHLPDLDDEFARDLGKFASFAELRGKVAEDLMERERRKAREAARSEAMEQLVRSNPDV
ncbi:MAG TPA: trigger factor, partial [Candidatus Polarisedimenticolia bacterium]|nr:trigger factor [Candidatus Polarisedimenticolia bacterium]